VGNAAPSIETPVPQASSEPSPVTKLPPRAPSKTISIPSLSDLKNQLNKKEETTTGEVTEEAVSNRNKAFTLTDLDKVWNAFKAKREEEGNQLELLILKEPYELEGNTVTIQISNGASESSFERFRGDLLMTLRDGLENDSLILKSEVVDIAREKMLYTDKEKFEHLKKKYPALKDLQERLGLDPEF